MRNKFCKRKIFLLIGLFLCISVFGQSITKEFTQTPLSNVLKEIERQTGLSVIYDKKEINGNKLITQSFREMPVEKVLSAILDENMDYTIRNKMVMIHKKNVPDKAESQQGNTKNFSGTITDSNGEPAIGANITVKDSRIRTITDVNGKFSINAPLGSILSISYIGYATKEVKLNENTDLQIVIQEDQKLLDEVVVVGYGVQKKVNLTGSVTAVKFDETLDNRPITNASQALSGLVPGMWVSQNSGKPGDDGAQLRIRGWGTLNNSDPLVIIDGIEGNFNQINPNDIESISILKDAASSAIYGSKAANGVVLVKTKMGNRNEQTKVSYSSYVGVQSLGRKFNLINNSAESMDILNQAQLNEGKAPIFPDYLVESFRTGTDPYKYPNTDWFDTFYRNAVMHEHNMSIRGGSEKSSTFMSANYLGQEGLVPNTRVSRMGIRANVEYNVNDWLTVGGRFSYIRRTGEEPYDLGRAFELLRGSAPYIAPYTRDGRFGSSEAIDNKGAQLYDNRNPLIETANGLRKTADDILTASVFLGIDFTKELKLQATYSQTGIWTMIDQYNEPVFGYTDSGMETMTLNFNRNGIEMIRNQITDKRDNLHAVLNYNKTFGKHETTLVTGLQTESYERKNVRARRSNPAKTGLTQVDAGTAGIQGDGNLVGLRMFSYFGRLNYSFAGKYLFEANFRADASSRFRKENHWGYFPGFSAGWRLSEEEFIKPMNLFSNLKLRASWGQLGNQSIDGYWPYLSIISQSNSLSYNYNGTLSPGAAVTALVDNTITWETSTSSDIGLEAGFLNGKLNVEAGYFHKVTSGIIVQLPIPQILGGLTAPYENIGKMLNKGIDISADYGNKVRDKDRFGYNVGVNFAYVDNKVTKFQGGNSPDQLFLIREGYSYQTLYGYKVVGIYQSDEEAAEHMRNNGFKPKAGDLKFEDVAVNGQPDGKLDYNDKQALGKTIPPITYGISGNFSYKRFDLNILLQGINGANLFTRNQFTTLELVLQSVTEKWRDAWTPEHTNTNIPRLKLDSSWDQSDNSFWVHRSDFLKIKNIQLGYTLPQSISSRLKTKKIYLYANAQNLHTIMWYKGFEGFDPERASNGDGGGVYPIARVFSFGVNVNF